jgi:hypothetical protein
LLAYTHFLATDVVAGAGLVQYIIQKAEETRLAFHLYMHHPTTGHKVVDYCGKVWKDRAVEFQYFNMDNLFNQRITHYRIFVPDAPWIATVSGLTPEEHAVAAHVGVIILRDIALPLLERRSWQPSDIPKFPSITSPQAPPPTQAISITTASKSSSSSSQCRVLTGSTRPAVHTEAVPGSATAAATVHPRSLFKDSIAEANVLEYVVGFCLSISVKRLAVSSCGSGPIGHLRAMNTSMGPVLNHTVTGYRALPGESLYRPTDSVMKFAEILEDCVGGLLTMEELRARGSTHLAWAMQEVQCSPKVTLAWKAVVWKEFVGQNGQRDLPAEKDYAISLHAFAKPYLELRYKSFLASEHLDGQVSNGEVSLRANLKTHGQRQQEATMRNWASSKDDARKHDRDSGADASTRSTKRGK